jgi:hypothetical protein
MESLESHLLIESPFLFDPSSFLESMKLPTAVSNGSNNSTKPSSGFHICDILELNKDKGEEHKGANEIKRDVDELLEEKSCDEDDDEEVRKENLSGESEENLHTTESPAVKRKHSPSPTSQLENEENNNNNNERESSERSKSKKKHMKQESDAFPSQHQQMLNDTIHQYSSHLFQNHPAMRPWFNSNGKSRHVTIPFCCSAISRSNQAHRSMVPMMNVT